MKFNIVTQIDGNFYWIVELLEAFFHIFIMNYCYCYCYSSWIGKRNRYCSLLLSNFIS